MDKLTIKTNNIALKFNTGSIVVTGGNVESVNGKTGPSIILDATDVSAEPAGAVQQAKDEIQPQINELNNEVDLIQPQLVNLSENKLDKVDYVQHFLGVFLSKAALDAAHRVARPGDSADIDSGAGFDVMRAIWDESDQKWVIREVNNAQNTDQVPEGNTNLYFKTERVLATLLSGFNPVNAAIAATDTIIQGLSKAQGQISNIISTFATNVRSTTLIDLNPAAGTVTASDTILSAFNKIVGTLSTVQPVVWRPLSEVGAVTSVVANRDIEFAKINGNIWIRGSFSLLQGVTQNTAFLTITNPEFKCLSNRANNGSKLLSTVRMNGDNFVTRDCLFFSSANVTNDSQASTVAQNIQTGSFSLTAADGFVVIQPVPLGREYKQI